MFKRQDIFDVRAVRRVLQLLIVLAVGVNWLFGIGSASNAKTLKGGVIEQDLRLRSGAAERGRVAPSGNTMRVSRADRPLSGSVVDANAFAEVQSPRPSGLQGGLLDDSTFAAPPKGFDIGAERNSREMVLAWEKWHRQLSQAIYTRWQRIARDPGKATLKVTITRDRHIMARVVNSDGGPEFDSVVLEAIDSLDGNPGLTFPAKSMRQQVSFEADYIASSHVRPGYSWVKNDYERVHQDY